MISIKILALGFLFMSCQMAKSQKKYYNDLGEIRFDANLDDENYKVCRENLTLPFNYGRVGLVYEGEKPELVKTYEDQYSNIFKKGQTGYFTIRFIINCEGIAGRYRFYAMDLNLKKMKFEREISDQLLQITKGLKGWKPYFSDGKSWDYQQYLTFKIVDGKLKKVLP